MKVDFFNKCFKYSKDKRKEYDKKEAYEIAEERIKEDMCVFNIM